jgi:signal recognition particle GTPase
MITLQGISEEEQKAMEDRFKDGRMSFQDFLKQVQMMQKMGSLQSMVSKVPGMAGRVPDRAQLEEGEKRLRRYSNFVEQMTEEEQKEPDLVIREAQALKGGGVAGQRLTRIAQAAKSEPQEVARFALEFNVMRGAAVKFARGESPESIRDDMAAEQAAVTGPKNRAMRRMAKKQGKKTGTVSKGFAK